MTRGPLGDVGAILLLLTPVGAVALGAVVLAERPTPIQLVSCVLVLAAAYFAATQRSESDANQKS